ncbi:MAG: undecaprenyl diphosphate synthase family protein, partial [Muribaculaceae bacterium]|nr:undecaprenyl diphosphate synthase family protein [Muribaculaceae bacterium]
YFTDTYWPDFGRQAFIDAVAEYQKRERRYGLTSEQIKENND